MGVEGILWGAGFFAGCGGCGEGREVSAVFVFADVVADAEVAVVAALCDEVAMEGCEYGASGFAGVCAVAEAAGACGAEYFGEVV